MPLVSICLENTFAGEESRILPPDLLLFPCEVFSSENPIVSELGWDLGLVPRGLSLGNEINKEYILVFQAL